MRTLSFSGASDDNIYVVGGPKMYDQVTSNVPVSFVVGGVLLVTVGYGENGTWGVGLAQWEEGQKVPNWPMRFTNASENEYSIQFEVDVPDEVSVVKVS
jgi:hypothetical protein